MAEGLRQALERIEEYLALPPEAQDLLGHIQGKGAPRDRVCLDLRKLSDRSRSMTDSSA